MKNANVGTTEKGASDKALGDKQGWKFFPASMEEVPPVDVLQRWGRKNLRYILKYWELTLAKGVTVNGCLCPTDAIQKLMRNIGQAMVLADESFPLIPDLRLGSNWIEEGESVVLYEIVCEAGVTYRRFRSYNAIVTGFTRSETPPEINEVGLKIIEETEKSKNVRQKENDEKKRNGEKVTDEDEVCKFDEVSYDLYSPYIMKSAEVAYFSAHPDALLVWAELCGVFYTVFRINEEMRDTLMREFIAE